MSEFIKTIERACETLTADYVARYDEPMDGDAVDDVVEELRGLLNKLNANN